MFERHNTKELRMGFVYERVRHYCSLGKLRRTQKDKVRYSRQFPCTIKVRYKKKEISGKLYTKSKHKLFNQFSVSIVYLHTNIDFDRYFCINFYN